MATNRPRKLRGRKGMAPVCTSAIVTSVTGARAAGSAASALGLDCARKRPVATPLETGSYLPPKLEPTALRDFHTCKQLEMNMARYDTKCRSGWDTTHQIEESIKVHHSRLNKKWQSEQSLSPKHFTRLSMARRHLLSMNCSVVLVGFRQPHGPWLIWCGPNRSKEFDKPFRVRCWTKLPGWTYFPFSC